MALKENITRVNESYLDIFMEIGMGMFEGKIVDINLTNGLWFANSVNTVKYYGPKYSFLIHQRNILSTIIYQCTNILIFYMTIKPFDNK